MIVMQIHLPGKGPVYDELTDTLHLAGRTYDRPPIGAKVINGEGDEVVPDVPPGRPVIVEQFSPLSA